MFIWTDKQYAWRDYCQSVFNPSVTRCLLYKSKFNGHLRLGWGEEATVQDEYMVVKYVTWTHTWLRERYLLMAYVDKDRDPAWAKTRTTYTWRSPWYSSGLWPHLWQMWLYLRCPQYLTTKQWFIIPDLTRLTLCDVWLEQGQFPLLQSMLAAFHAQMN